MKVVYKNEKVKSQCTSLKEARKLFGGNDALARSLHSRIYAIEQAAVIKDIIVLKPFHFHNLKGGLSSYFAIDVKTHRDKWRIILQPLDENEEAFTPCNIDEISSIVKTVCIREVSPHYE